MALTLPYPSLVFVPLDKLTAEEMNQIVANYEAIANQFPIGAAQIAAGAIGANQIASSAVTTAKIANSAVTTSKLAWSGFGAVNAQASGSTKVTINQSEKNVLSADVSQFPTGALLCALSFVGFSGTNDVTAAFTQLRHGSQRSRTYATSNTWAHTSANGYMFTKEASYSTVNIYAWKDTTYSLTAGEMNLMVFRVG